jgi:RNA polymerase sigma-70 factor (ECF subfamily)
MLDELRGAITASNGGRREEPSSARLTGPAHSLTVSRLTSVREMAELAAPAPSAADFARIYQDHVDFVWRYAATHGIEPASLDDVVQEVFMVVHGRLSSFEQRSSLKTWLAGIAVNVVRSFRRRRTARRIGEPLADGEEVPAQQASAAEALELKQSLELLDGVLARMTELQREAFVLCELEQFSQVEVANMLGINENTLRTRLRSARQLVNELAREQRAAQGAT